MPDSQELKGAKISRGTRRTKAGRGLDSLQAMLRKLEDKEAGQVTISEIEALTITTSKAEEYLEKYEESINKCVLFEGKEEDPEGEHTMECEEMSDKMDTLRNNVAGLKARVKEEKNARARQEAIEQGRVEEQGNKGRVTAKPPPLLDKNVTLDCFEIWSSTWEDYYTVTKLEKESRDTQRANLKSYLTQDMRGIVEHVLGIDAKSTKSCNEILKDIKAHIRSSRNIQIDKVAFEKRSQKQGESFDDYLVAIKKLARNADLCQVCLDDRLLTKIMAGVLDQEVREELLGKVPPPNLEEAIIYARSKESAKKSNMDLTGKITVQQIKGRDRLRSRSESPGGVHGKKQGTKCYFCIREDCFHSSYNKCQAYGKQCQKCGLQDHFKNSVACKYGFTERKTKSKPKAGRAIQLVRGLAGSKRAPKAYLNIRTVNGKKHIGSTEFYPDSAADCTIMGQRVMRKLGIQPGMLDPPDSEGVNAANETAFTMVGTMKVTMEYCGRTVKEVIHVVKEEETDLLVSWDTCIGFGILHKDYPKPMGEVPVSARSVTINKESEPRMEGKEIPSQEEEDVQALAKKLISTVDDKDNPSEADRKLMKEKLMEKFKEVFAIDKGLKPMNCTPMSIRLKPGAMPTQLSTPRKIGPSIKPRTKEELMEMVKMKVIDPVPVDYHTDWCHPFCPREKSEGGGIRPTVDLRGLNDWVESPTHPVTSPYEAVHSLTPGAQWFTALDAKNGYHQILLDKEAQDLTCFITPWGRYKFLRGPQGFVGTGHKYNYESDRWVASVPETAKVVDDIAAANITFRQNLLTTIRVLERCRKGGITLSPKKFKFAEEEIKFVGYIVGRNGIRADPEKLKAIREYPKPTNISELRSFDGMINHIGNFSTELTEARGVIRELRSKKNIFSWNREHDEAFEAIKECLANLTVLTQFDPKLPTRLTADGSKLKGLGYTLQQEHGKSCTCKCSEMVWKNIQCGSRFLTDTESRYAPIEFEALSVVWAVTKCKYFLVGLPEFLIRNDHKTLIPILNNYNLNDIENPRVRRLVEKLRPYKYRAEHISGNKNTVADAFSRAPVDKPSEDDCLGEGVSPQIRRIVRRAASCVGVEDEVNEKLLDPNLEWIRNAATSDPIYQELVETVKIGFPDDRAKMTEAIRPYYQMRNELSELQGLVVLQSRRIVVPTALRKEVLKRLHASHQGVDRTQRRARETVYWPGITSDISNTVSSCGPCAERLPSNPKETMRTDKRPERAFEQTATDLFEYGGRTYISYVDRYSGWPCVHMWSSTPTSAKVIEQLRKWFVDLGIPLRVRSDGGPQFDSAEYREFLEKWGVNPPGLSSPTYAQSNGLAESAVKAMKALVAKTSVNGDISCDEFQRGLLEWRNTPRAHGKSPAELVFGCQTRSVVPSLEKNLNPPWKAAIESKIAELQVKAEKIYNIGAKDLRELSVGDEVRIQDSVSKRWTETGVVARKGQNRDYHVELPNGRLRWRNRRFLRPITSSNGGEKESGNDQCEKDNIPYLRRGTRDRKRTVHFSI